jgi:TPP-dependent pyruvate/acetoin dehydrogenase alpha subunit
MSLTKEQLIKLYTDMLLTRKVDELMVKGITEGKVLSFFHSGQGNEAYALGMASFHRPDDIVYPNHRGHAIAAFIAKAEKMDDINTVVAEHYGKATGFGGGITGFHGANPDRQMYGGGATIGSAFSISVGLALAAKKNGRGQVTICGFGDGSTGRGPMHEAMNMASVWKLPIVWICENNLYAQYMPIKDAYPNENIADMAPAYNMPGSIVDGQDVIAVYEAVQKGVERARKGEGPSLIECKTYRFRSHGEGVPDLLHYDPRPQAEIDTWKKRDPIQLFQKKLLKEKVLTQADVERIERETQAYVDAADKYAMESPQPDPAILKKLVYAD